MKLRPLFLLFIFLVPARLAGQSVPLTGTVTDTPDNQTWNNGTITFTFFGPQGGSYRWTGGTLNPNTPITASLSATGTYSLSVPDNSQITPADSSWNITVCPAVLPAVSACFKTNRVVTSAGTTLNLAPPSPRFVVPTTPQSVSPISAYNDSEITGAWLGFSYYNLTISSGKNCVSAALTGCTAYAAPTPPGQFSVKGYGAVGDARSTRDCAVTLNSQTVTSASNPWLSTDVGKFIYTSQGYGNPPFNPQHITGFNSAGSISVTLPALGTGTGPCTWYTQKDDTGFANALTAAKASLQSSDPHFSSPTLAYQGTMYCPPGGYVLSTPWFNQVYATANTNAVSFQGAGRGSCTIYISPDFVAGASAVFGFVQQGSNYFMDGFTIEGDLMIFSLGNLPGFQLSNMNQVRLSNFTIQDYQNTQDTSFGLIFTSNSSSQLLMENLFLVGGETLYSCSGTGNVLGLNNVLSNGIAPNLHINCGNRGPNAQSFTWVGGQIDECGTNVTTHACTQVDAGVVANFVGVPMYGESATAGALNCLGFCYVTNSDVGSFNSGTNQPALVIGASGYVEATGTWFRGNGTSPAISAPSTATFVDAGGNRFMTGTGSGPFTDVTAAQYSTLGVTGGLVPKATVTHTPNTCYAVTGNLLATAQNLCTILLDQNYQVLTISAQSGGTTPAASSCATPPVITLSDGTRTETMQMTSGQTVWCSATSGTCTGSTVTNPNQVFASGALLTVSIGANTCATPPSNVSVNYDLQSVLNP